MSVWSETKSIAFATVKEWLEDGVPGRGAALSFYVLLSLGPILVLLVGVLELFLSADAVRALVLTAVEQNTGARFSRTVELILEQVDPPALFSLQSLFTIGVLLFGATAVFLNIRESLNLMWGVSTPTESPWDIVRQFFRGRVKALVMIAATAVLLIVSLVVTWAVTLLGSILQATGVTHPFFTQVLDLLVAVVVSGALFAAIYHTLPAVRIEWRTVWVGALATAILFVLGQQLVAALIANAAWTTYYGPGTSVVAFVAWIYFSAQIFYLGAEFTQVWSRRRGGVMAPEPELEEAVD